ncbi:MAG: hypothetical protein J0L99_19330 [Chitinophagales bacterium]|nr:hypothetical protein [Chitinophagales bacterium]
MPQLDNPKINIKIQLAGLWASLMSLYIYADYFQFFTPGHIGDMMAGKVILDTPSKLFAASILMAVPALMIALSLLLPAPISRWVNIITAAFYTGLLLLIGISSSGEWMLFYIFYAFLESLVTAIIVWKAWKWPLVQTHA